MKGGAICLRRVGNGSRRDGDAYRPSCCSELGVERGEHNVEALRHRKVKGVGRSQVHQERPHELRGGLKIARVQGQFDREIIAPLREVVASGFGFAKRDGA